MAVVRAGAIAVSLVLLSACAAPGAGGGRQTPTAEPTPAAAAVGPEVRQLVTLLRGGGQVLYLRHGATDDALDQSVDFDDCSTQRNLSREGREQAGRIGRALQRARIPVGHVLASPYCRTVETAALAFGEAEVQVDRRLAAVQPEGGGRARVQALRRLLATAPVTGNRVLVGHTANVERAAGVLLPEGGAAVFTPRGQGFRLRGTLAPADFAALTGG